MYAQKSTKTKLKDKCMLHVHMQLEKISLAQCLFTKVFFVHIREIYLILYIQKHYLFILLHTTALLMLSV